jgi:hypothetical protein
MASVKPSARMMRTELLVTSLHPDNDDNHHIASIPVGMEEEEEEAAVAHEIQDVQRFSKEDVVYDDSAAETSSIWVRLRREAEQVIRNEPELTILLKNTILSPGVESFEDAVAMTVCYRLLLQSCGTGNGNDRSGMQSTVLSTGATQPPPASARTPTSASLFCPHSLRDLLRKAMDDTETLEYGHAMRDAIRDDALAVCQRDPAMDTILEVVLFSKGYTALVCHRAAFQLWNTKNSRHSFYNPKPVPYLVYCLDIHPKA